MAKRDDKEKKDEGKEEKLEVKEEAGKEKEKELPEIEPPAPKGEPWPDATPEPMKPVAAQSAAAQPVASPMADVPTQPVERPRTETVTMPQMAKLGSPPEMPKTTAPPP